MQLHAVDLLSRQLIFAEGEPGDRLLIIIAGKVKISRRSGDGRENIVAILGPSDMFGELSVFDPAPRPWTAAAITDVRAVGIDRDALRGWIAERPEIGERLQGALARQLKRASAMAADLACTDVPPKISRELLAQAQRFGTDESGALRVADLTQGEIAELVGTAREIVNKTLSEFAGRGWIEVGAQKRADSRLRAACHPSRKHTGGRACEVGA